MKYTHIHFSRIVVSTAICLSAITSLCQTPIEKQLGANPVLQKIIAVREVRDSVNKKQDSILLKLDKAIAAKYKLQAKKK